MIGITSVTFRNKSIEEVVDICTKANIKAIEWGGDIHVKPGDIEAANKARELCEKANIKCASYGSYFFLGKNKVEDFKPMVEVAKALGVKYIRIIAGDWTINRTSNEFTTDEVEGMIKDLKEMVKMVEDSDIVIASEFHPHTFNDTAKTAKLLLNAVNSEHYKTYWQTVEYDDRDVEYLKELKDDVVTVHVFSWKKNGVRMPLKKKSKLFSEVVEIMGKDVNYLIEFVKKDSDKQFFKDAEVLHNILGE